jgi:hypothetical protein
MPVTRPDSKESTVTGGQAPTETPSASSRADVVDERSKATLSTYFRRPPTEAVGGAVFGGVVGAFAFGPAGAIGGLLIGAIVAVSTTRRFASGRR